MAHTRIVTILGLGPKREYPYYENVLYENRVTNHQATSSSPLSLNFHLDAALRTPGDTASVEVVGTVEVHRRWHEEGALHRALTEYGHVSVDYRFNLAPSGSLQDDARLFTELLMRLLGREQRVGEPCSPDRVWFDLTNGFRAQGVLATAAVEAVTDQALRDGKEPNVEVFYAAFEEAQKGPEINGRPGPPIGPAPIWELSGVIEQHTWTAAVHAFISYGRADALRILLNLAAKDVIARDNNDRILQQRTTALTKAAGAARGLADGLSTSRVSFLLTGESQRFAEAFVAVRPELIRLAPALERPLDELVQWARSFIAERPISPEGVRATLALARFANQTQRFSECAVLLREATISAYTVEQLEPSVVLQPAFGDRKFDEQRAAMDAEVGGKLREVQSRFARNKSTNVSSIINFHSEFGQIRNDIEHAGFNSTPMKAERIRNKLSEMIDKAELALVVGPAARPMQP